MSQLVTQIKDTINIFIGLIIADILKNIMSFVRGRGEGSIGVVKSWGFFSNYEPRNE